MATTSPATLLTPGQGARINQPAAGSGQFRWVVLSNLSTYQLTVQAGADTFILAPFCEQIFDLGESQTAPIGLNPTLLNGQAVVPGATAQVNATWYGLHEKPQGTWPISLTAQALASISGVLSTQAAFQVTQLDNVSMALGTSILYQIGQFASLQMHLQNAVAGQKVSITIVWYYDVAGTNLIAGDNFALGEHPLVVMVDSYEIPVRGTSFRVFNNGQSQGSVFMVLSGSNREVQSIKQTITTQMPRTLTIPTTNMVSGTAYPFVNSDGLGDYTTLNGSQYLYYAQSPSEQGELFAAFTGYNAQQGQFILFVNTPVNTNQFNHPNVPCRWQWFSLQTVAGVSMSIGIIPTGPT